MQVYLYSSILINLKIFWNILLSLGGKGGGGDPKKKLDILGGSEKNGNFQIFTHLPPLINNERSLSTKNWEKTTQMLSFFCCSPPLKPCFPKFRYSSSVSIAMTAITQSGETFAIFIFYILLDWFAGISHCPRSWKSPQINWSRKHFMPAIEWTYLMYQMFFRVFYKAVFSYMKKI